MPFLRNFVVRVIVAGLLAWLSLYIHMDVFEPTNPVGMVVVYILFVGLAWAGANFQIPFLGKAFGYAVPNIFIPPIILLPLRNIFDSITISWLIGAGMAIYSAFMVGWMLKAYDKAQRQTTGEAESAAFIEGEA